MTPPIVCYRCNGEGFIVEDTDVLISCPICNGKGSIGPIEITIREAVTTVPCPICQRCPGCGGAHMVTPERAAALRKVPR